MNKQSPDNATLIPVIPTELENARIGTCFNSMTRTLLDRQMSFSPAKLNGAGLLLSTRGRLQMVCHANASSSAFAKESFFAAASKVKAGGWGVKATAGLNMNTANKSAGKSFEINCYMHYIDTGRKLSLMRLNAQPRQWFNCMDEGFQEKYTAVMEAESPDEYVEAYANFLAAYGDGCVTVLHLAAGSAIKLALASEENEIGNAAKYGAEAAVGFRWGGASVAREWGRSMAAVDKEAATLIVQETVPSDSPTRDWAEKMAEKYSTKAIEELLKPGGEPTPPEQRPTIDSPDIPEEKPSDKEVPERKLDDAENKDVEIKIIKEMMKEDGFEISGDEPTDEEIEDYRSQQEELLRRLSAESVVEEINEARKQATFPTRVDTTPVLKVNETFPLTGDEWDLGGYVPVGYEVTPWAELFPDLALNLPSSSTRFFLAKLWTFLSTRLEFSQYLQFLKDVHTSNPSIVNNLKIDADASNYANVCQSFAQHLSIGAADMMFGGFTENDYMAKVALFEQMALDGSRGNELSTKGRLTYERFFSSYKFFLDNTFGFIWTDESHKYYDTFGGRKPLNTMSEMLKNSIRLFPVIDCDQDGVVLVFAARNGMFYPLGGAFSPLAPGVHDDFRTQDFTRNGQVVSCLGVGHAEVQQISAMLGGPMFWPDPERYEGIKEGASLYT